MIRIRDAGQDDVASILACARDSDAAWSERAWRDAIEAGYTVHLMCDEDMPCGAAVVMHCLDDAELLEVIVDARRRGEGLGRRLMEHALGTAKERGAARMLLEVRESNLAARALYLSLGFEQTGLRKHYYPLGTGREHAVMMEKRT
ncbi:ribosomal protein S18-alanine N-acetyltransferase [Paludibacterium paludis]|uniref:[Ribosomal protein bS18]-alanine N-acetyltransferase n=1 Tax=Paludibacterium paludis TaxID=1225769 RepID=A0A918P571_9NEIS|nr:ribosomal protein S18-alanine N-acetyltransferase [Paludibacterium paludis]GGY21962.1 hypothetical protein GCM10011289_27160 [Paludibacterium paludis]